MLSCLSAGGGLQHRPCYVLSVCRDWLGWGYNTDSAVLSVCRGWVTTQTVLRAFLSVSRGWVTTHTMLCAFLSVSRGWVTTQTMLCAFLSVCRGWGGVTAHTVLRAFLSVSRGWVAVGLQHRPCYVPFWLYAGVGLPWGYNTDRVTCLSVCMQGLGYNTCLPSCLCVLLNLKHFPPLVFDVLKQCQLRAIHFNVNILPLGIFRNGLSDCGFTNYLLPYISLIHNYL